MTPLAIAIAIAQMPSAPVVSVPAIGSAPPPVQQLVTWRPGEVRCGGEVVAPVRMVRPRGAIGWSATRETAATRTFRIDAGGRPLGISGGSGYGDAVDLGPALAASRFAPGGERRDCSVGYAATRVPVTEADRDELIAYSVLPTGVRPRALWDRVAPAGSDCFAPAPAVRNRAYPDFKAIPQRPGETDWTMVGFDIDAAGRPVRMQTAAGTGSAALDRAAAAAVAASRFAPGARSGCLYPYRRAGGTVPAPASPEPAGSRAAGATCPADLPWATKPVPSYPEPYRRRSIEGWALVGFDVAPWGATGNVRVLAAEPAAEFGEYAVRTIRTATKKPSATGHVGCVERVRFAIGDRPNTGEPGSPPG